MHVGYVMAFEETHSWTLGGLIGAFIDLFVAYFLLCGSSIAFFVSKFFTFFGLHLPCPCKGSFGFRNSNYCLHKILFEWPLKKICSIQVMAAKRFPFDLVWVKKGNSSCNGSDKVVVEKTYDNNRVVELEDEAHCSSCSGLSLVDKESGYDAKGKRIMSMKRRSGIRRRKRGSYDCGKISLVVPCDNLQSDVALTSCLPCEGSSIIKDRSSQSLLNPASAKELSVRSDEDAQTGHDLDEITCHSYEFNGSMVGSPGLEKYSSSLEQHYTSTAQDNVQIVGNEDNRIKMLENALEEEKAAYAALYLELEKERSAAATAADEAMAMISRLQEEKASMGMEMRQYQRLIEERVAYDEEEMNILQEILIRREMENFYLEKELEGYRQMGLKGSYQSNGKPKVQPDEWGQSFETCEGPPQAESTISVVKNSEISDISSNYIVAQSCVITEHGEELETNTEHKDQACDDLHSSVYDTEPDVLDVHVIDDNMELREKEIEKSSSSSCSTVSNKPINTYPEFGSLEVQSRSSCPWESKTENDNNVDGSTNQLSMFYNSKCKSVPFDSASDSSCAVHNEKLKIDNEIEILEERLRMVKHEKEKLTLFADKGESQKGQLKLLEEITNHLQQIKQLRNPVRGASLPPSWSKVNLRKRRCQSATWETCESC